MQTLTALLFVLLLSPLSAGAQAAAPDAYVPLQTGLTWEFRQKIIDLKTQAPMAEAKAVKKNLAPVQMKGLKGVPQTYIFYPPGGASPQETVSVIAQDDRGFFVLARKAANDPEPKMLEEKFYILKLPLQKGTSWQQPAEGLIIHNSIEDTAATVQVPAGTYTNCVLVKKLFYAGADSKKPVQEALFWFAPGVGNVKVQMKHLAEQKEMVLELASFKK